MLIVFYLASLVAIISTLLVITRVNAVHALLYLVVSLLSVALVFYLLGSPFAAALEVIVYAGAIMVLFIFVVMMLNLGPAASEEERRLLEPSMWQGPGILALILLVELGYVLFFGVGGPAPSVYIAPWAVGAALYGPYIIAVELASFLLLAGLVGAYHLGRREGDGR